MAHLVLFPLIVALGALVTCVTHQFQSWLGRLFANKRRRGTVVAVAVLLFVALVNLPALLNPYLRGSDVSMGMEQIQQWALVANAVFPPGWLALGAWGATGGPLWISALATIGLFAIALLSLRRSYRKTLGAIALDERHSRRTGGEGKKAPATTDPVTPATGRALVLPPGLRKMLEAVTRYIPDHSRAVAWVALRLWIRGPQGKMVLLSPLLLIMLYLLFFRGVTEGGNWATQFAVLAMLGLTIMMAFNLFSNVFGQDGSGFRAVVLAGVSPIELLLGKNLALLPYALLIGSLIIALLQWVHPLPATHVLANFAQLLVLYLVGCMLGNAFSIRARRGRCPPPPSAAGATPRRLRFSRPS